MEITALPPSVVDGDLTAEDAEDAVLPSLASEVGVAGPGSSSLLPSPRMLPSPRSFDVSSLSLQQLLDFVWDIFDSLAIPDLLQIGRSEFMCFAESVRDGYLPAAQVAYHTFAHAVDVLHNVYVYVVDMGASQLLDQEEVCGLMLAALCHDIGHMGVNNGFFAKVGVRGPSLDSVFAQLSVRPYARRTSSQLAGRVWLVG